VKYLQTILAAVAFLLVFAFPAWGQETSSSDACQNPQEVVTVGPTTENTKTPFTTTGDVFRVSYDVAFDDPEAFNHADIDIETPSGGLVEFANVSEDETNSYIVTEGAGSYNLVVKIDPPNGATYTVTIEDCGATTQGNGDDNGTAADDQYSDGAADDQYNDGGGSNDGGDVSNGDVSNDDDGGDVSNPKDVIPDTTSKKPLPNTGGVPLLGLAVCALAFVGIGFSVFRSSIRRNQ